MKYFDEAAVRAALRWDPLIAAMESALAAFSSGRVIQPVRKMITIEEDKRYLGIMPAVAEESMGLKLVSFYPGNAGTGVPTHSAMVMLFRPDTGEPLAVMDGRLLTEMRTAAVSAAATKRLASPGSRVLAWLGSGVQAGAPVQALARVRDFDEVRVWSQTPENARKFAQTHGILAAPDVGRDIFKQLAAAIENSADRVTLYASSHDEALAVSKKLHEFPRAGEAGKNLLVMKGIDTIDVSTVDTSLLGHSYFGDNSSVISDIRRLLMLDSPPGQRSCLSQAFWSSLAYWVFASAACPAP